MDSSKIFAIVPAAGLSQRMGRPKLLLPWKGRLVIDSVLNAWTTSRVQQTLVVVRREDRNLVRACSNWPVEIVELEHPTEDMKETIIHGMKHLEAAYSLTDEDVVMLAPADLPRISKELIDEIANATCTERIVIPSFGGKQGHPIRISWQLKEQVYSLQPNQGINRLLDSNAIGRIEFPETLRPRDIDTPSDYDDEVQAEQESN